MRRSKDLTKNEKKATKPKDVKEEVVKETEKEVKKVEEKSTEEKLLEEIAEQKDIYLRLAAEYDNFRKRTAKEREETFTNAKATIFEELIPVIDNFERAEVTSATTLQDYKKGVDMIFSGLLEVFSKFGVESFGEVGETFDPNIHNAVMHEENDKLEANVITDVFQKGYKIGDKVLRVAMVKVAN
ncbi:MAG: nucleotide exchange factor GrpE [Ruminococcaceae bacterium]|nr:nucleotide exchange factor GrpE [Oscillospiraceae bacterium]